MHKIFKKKSAPGNDGIKNINLINLSYLGKLRLLNIFNNSWKHGKLINDWKIAEVIMLKKKDNDCSNPNNYRPISLTKCKGKLMEKLIKYRLISFLNKHDILSPYQSGFRSNRQTTDNLFYFNQKTFEAFDEKKTTIGLVLDIQQAFDKIWHTGLLYKLSKINLPKKLGNWIKDSISKRKYYVKVDKAKSDIFTTTAGLFQGTILSPILFSIFINDITEINNLPTNKISTLLFADDLFAFFADKNINRLFIIMQKYITNLELWFNKWRLQLSTNKCSYNIFRKGNLPNNIKNKKLILFSSDLKIDKNPTYLGLTIDSKLKYKTHADNIKEKCTRCLNVISNLSYKNWSLKTEEKLTVYKCLIRSKMEYAAPALFISKYYIQLMNGIQYKALKIIFKEKTGVSSTSLHNKAKISTISNRFNLLSKNYFKNSIVNLNPLNTSLYNTMNHSSGENKTPIEQIIELGDMNSNEGI